MDIFRHKEYLLLLVFLLTLPLLHPWVNSDGIAYYAQLRSMLIDHDLQFANEYAHYNEVFTRQSGNEINTITSISQYQPGQSIWGRFTPDEPLTATRHTPNRTSFGPAVLWLPFFLIGDCLVILLNLFGMHLPRDGYSLWYVIPMSLGTVLYGLLGLGICYRFLRRFVSEDISFYTVLIFWFASPLIYYMYLVPSMAHTLAFFTIALFIYYWWQSRDTFTISQAVILGFIVGLAGMVRWQNIVIGIIPILDQWFQYKNRSSSCYVIYLSAVMVGFLPQMIAWKIVYGHFLLIPMGNDTMNWFTPQILSVLFSSRHGLFYWHPVFLMGLFGWLAYSRKFPWCGGLFLLFFGYQVYINGVPTNWWCGSSFGYRRMLDLLPLFMLGFAYLWQSYSSKRINIAFITAGILLVIWNMGLLIQFSLGMISHTEPVTFSVIWTNQWTVVPGKIARIFHYLLTRQ